MKDLTKSIREATGLNMDEFCEKHLDSDWRAFSIRDRKKKLYPNEALYICLITGKNPMELFEQSSLDLFFLSGKDGVTKRLKNLLKQRDAIDKMNLILSNPNGLKISMTQSDEPRKEKPARESKTEKQKTAAPKKVADEFDFVDDDVFRPRS